MDYSENIRKSARTSWPHLYMFGCLLSLGSLVNPLQAYADLKPIDDAAMGEVIGQGAPVSEMGGQVTYDALVYTDPDGNEQVIRQGKTSSDGEIGPYNRPIKGITFGNQSTGSVIDFLSFVMPLRYGAVDIDGDGQLDRGAAILSYAPNIGFGTGSLAIDIKAEDITTVINDQVFVTNQGVLFLNAPATSDGSFAPPGSTETSLAPVPVRYF